MVQMVHPARQPSIAHRNTASPTPLRRAKPNTLNTACFAGVFVSQRGRNVAENQAGEENLKLEFQTQAGGENLKLEFQTQAGGENLSELHELLLGQWFDASLYHLSHGVESTGYCLIWQWGSPGLGHRSLV